MNILRIFALAAALTASAAAIPAAAQQARPPVLLESKVMLERVAVAEDGTSTVELVEPEVIVPGDKLVFRTSYTNQAGEAITGFTVTNPLPGSVALAPDPDPALLVSVDGGAHWGRLAELTVAAEDGALRPAEPNDVTHIRWVIPEIAPDGRGTLEYHAIIR